MSDTRTLVPTPRQVELGETPPEDVAGPRAGGNGSAGANGTVGGDRPGEGGRRPNRWVQTLRDADPRKVEGPRVPLLVFGLVALLGQWDDAALGTLLPEIRAELGLSLQVLAAIGSVSSLIGELLAIPAGYLADRIRRTTLLRVSIVATNASSIVQATAGGVGQVVTGRLVAGGGTSVQQASSFSYLADVFPRTSRTRVFAFTGLIGLVGAVLGPLVAGALGQRFGWRITLGALGILATAVALTTLLLREPVRGRVDREEAGADEDLLDEVPPPLPIGEALRVAWSVRTVRRIVLATPFLYIKGAAGLQLLSTYYAEVLALTPSQRGFVVAGSAAASIFALIAFAPLGDRLLAERPGAFLPIMAAGTALQALSMLILGGTTNRVLAIGTAVPLGAIDVMLLPAFFSLLSQVVPSRVRGVGLQIQAPARFVGLVLFPPLVGIADKIGPRGIAIFAVPTAVAAIILAGGGPGTVRDRRTALAAGLAEAAARRAAREGRLPTLVARDVVAGYGTTTVVDGVDLDVAAGELLAIVGPNGAGKTTLLRTIAGVAQPLSGVVTVGGRDTTGITAHDAARSGVTLVPGGSAVIATLTVEEHLRAAAATAAAAGRRGADVGVDAPSVDDAVTAELAAHPLLADRRSQPAGTLSGGEQQLLALACARLTRPALLLVDELSLGLAPQAVRDALRAARVAADAGAAVVVVEQSVDAVLAVADRAVVLEKGAVVFSGTADELRERPGTLAGIALGSAGRTSAGDTASRARAGRRPVLLDDEAAIEVRDASIAFGGVQALTDVSVSVRPGEVVGLIGPNGAGKTTLFDVVSGFLAADAGTVHVGGVDLTGEPPHERARSGLGRSFQRARLFPGMSVRDAVLAALDRRAATGAGLAPLGLPSARRAEARLRRRADGTLELLGLDAWATVPVGELPTGTRRLVSLACTLAFEPSVLLLDEPTAGLSRLEAEDVPPLLRRTARETNAALLVVEHDVPLLATAADRLVAMVGGRVVADGLPDEVVADPTVLTAYLGRDEAAGPSAADPASPTLTPER